MTSHGPPAPPWCHQTFCITSVDDLYGLNPKDLWGPFWYLIQGLLKPHLLFPLKVWIGFKLRPLKYICKIIKIYIVSCTKLVLLGLLYLYILKYCSCMLISHCCIIKLCTYLLYLVYLAVPLALFSLGLGRKVSQLCSSTPTNCPPSLTLTEHSQLALVGQSQLTVHVTLPPTVLPPSPWQNTVNWH